MTPEVDRRFLALARAARRDLVRVIGDKNLADRCVVAAVYLELRARAAGFNVRVVGGAFKKHRAFFGVSHAWTLLDDHWTVDLTAVQFRPLPLVCVRPPGLPYRRFASRAEVIAGDVDPDGTLRVLAALGLGREALLPPELARSA